MGRLLILMVFLCFASCEVHDGPNHHTTIKVLNLSDKPIYVSGGWAWAPAYTSNDTPQWSVIVPDNLVESGAINTEALRRRPKSSYENIMSPHKYWIFFIDAEMLDNLSAIPDPIPEGLLLEKRLYSLDDLRQLNFSVTYP